LILLSVLAVTVISGCRVHTLQDGAYDFKPVEPGAVELFETAYAAIERAGTTEAADVARALEGARFDSTRLGGLHEATMRAADHQLQQPLVVSVMARAPGPGVSHDVEGSGYGFRTLRRLPPTAAQQPHSCRMARPD
jgi:branched-chain amino acid transport system substrate-binding protein